MTVTENTSLTLSLPPDLVTAINRYAAQRDLGSNQAEAAIQALRQWAINEGLLSPAGGDEGLRPEDLSAANDG
ncbi:MAG TPA: hypothetical protein VGN98_03255 [Tianweitania sediminis]|jgi:hypothetical protein|nr:hypothetical protein [Tianweitania sediminis]